MRALACVVVASVVMWTQVAAAQRFDAASIKRNTSGSRESGGSTTPNQIRATNVTLSWLLRRAYGLQDYQVVGAPEWTTTERYDVLARAEQAERNQIDVMLRNLLADRFRLVSRIETRELPVYALVLARPGQLGPRLTKTAITDCMKTGQFCGTNSSNMVIRSVAETMTRLAEQVSPLAGRTVIDRTGLDGRYDFEVTWTSDALRSPRPNDDGPSIFTALQEQLGLRLEAQRGPVEIMVIERVERPTED
jgi:uncharacterized protein (TIGR03435 family)